MMFLGHCNMIKGKEVIILMNIVAMMKCMNYDDYFDEKKVRKATSAYFGLCSFIGLQHRYSFGGTKRF